jgi:hypothetical protein
MEEEFLQLYPWARNDSLPRIKNGTTAAQYGDLPEMGHQAGVLMRKSLLWETT